MVSLHDYPSPIRVEVVIHSPITYHNLCNEIRTLFLVSHQLDQLNTILSNVCFFDGCLDGWSFYTNFLITKFLVNYVTHSSLAYSYFATSLKCGYPTILTNKIFHSHKNGSVGDNVHLPGRGKSLMTLTPTKYGTMCKILLPAHFLHSAIHFW